MAFLPCFLRRPDAALALPNGHDLLLLIGVFLAATSSGDPWIRKSQTKRVSAQVCSIASVLPTASSSRLRAAAAALVLRVFAVTKPNSSSSDSCATLQPASDQQRAERLRLSAHQQAANLNAPRAR